MESDAQVPSLYGRHAGSRFGWALVKDLAVVTEMLVYLTATEMCAPRPARARLPDDHRTVPRHCAEALLCARSMPSVDTQYRTLELFRAMLRDEGRLAGQPPDPNHIRMCTHAAASLCRIDASTM